MLRRLLLLTFMLVVPVVAHGQVMVADDDIQAGDEVVWTADNTYVLTEFVFVEDGATLTIEPGTVIKGEPGEGADASALIVAQGGQIFAEGTPTNPIIFTSTSDDVDDPDDHCVEIGGVDEASTESAATENDTPPLTGIFEVVLEVADLAAAESRYAALGFEVVDRGDERRRVRLRGPFDLELWEPQLGLADARGGVHVDLGLRTDDPAASVSALGDSVVSRESVDGGVRVRETDGHWLTFLDA